MRDDRVEAGLTSLTRLVQFGAERGTDVVHPRRADELKLRALERHDQRRLEQRGALLLLLTRSRKPLSNQRRQREHGHAAGALLGPAAHGPRLYAVQLGQHLLLFLLDPSDDQRDRVEAVKVIEQLRLAVQLAHKLARRLPIVLGHQVRHEGAHAHLAARCDVIAHDCRGAEEGRARVCEVVGDEDAAAVGDGISGKALRHAPIVQVEERLTHIQGKAESKQNRRHDDGEAEVHVARGFRHLRRTALHPPDSASEPTTLCPGLAKCSFYCEGAETGDAHCCSAFCRLPLGRQRILDDSNSLMPDQSTCHGITDAL
eukprot:3194797-Pleurochrysis_carterae.AAC.2